MVLSLSTDQLHVFAWDNTQALDAQSIEIIENTVWRLGDTRSVFVFASREGSYHPLESHPNHELLELSGLDENESHDLIAQRAGSPLVPLELIDFAASAPKGSLSSSKKSSKSSLTEGYWWSPMAGWSNCILMARSRYRVRFARSSPPA